MCLKCRQKNINLKAKDDFWCFFRREAQRFSSVTGRWWVSSWCSGMEKVIGAIFMSCERFVIIEIYVSLLCVALKPFVASKQCEH